jgi:PAS domain S-box-containing protein
MPGVGSEKRRIRSARGIIHGLTVLLTGPAQAWAAAQDADLTLASTSMAWAMGSAVLILLLLVGVLVWMLALRRQTGRDREAHIAFLQTFLDTIPNPVFYKNREGVHLGCNKAFEELLGRPREEILGRTMQELVPPDNSCDELVRFFQEKDEELYRDQDTDPAIQRFAATLPARAETNALAKSVLFHKAAFKDSNGRFAGQVGMIADASACDALAQQLHDAQREFDVLAETPFLGVGLTRKRRVIRVNARGAEIFGYLPEELLNTPPAQLCDPKRLGALFDELRAQISATGAYNAQGAFRKKDGSDAWLRIFAKPLVPGSLEHGVVWVWDDASSAHAEADALRQAKDFAEAGEQAKGQYLASLNRQFRGPLNGILGMAELALDDAVSPEQQRHLELIRDSGRALLDLLNDASDFTEIQDATHEPLVETFDMGKLVASTAELFSNEAIKKGLALNVSVDPELPTPLQGDPGRIRQILVHIISNSLANTQHGYVDISVQAASSPEERPLLAIAVCDTGSGMAPASADTAPASGDGECSPDMFRGLGLETSKRLAQTLGGELRIQCDLGVGSTFTLLLPLLLGKDERPPQAAQPSADASPETRPTPLRILVAEDNMANMLYLRHLLEGEGHFVTTSCNGLEALDALAIQRFDCVLMDAQMPEMDGVEATRRIRSGRAAVLDPAVPIIAVTAHALKGDKEGFLAAGMNAFVSKPVELSALRPILDSIAPITSESAGA